MQVAILGGGQGWHFAELERAFGARGHQAHVLRVSALVARIGDRPCLDAGGVALQDVDAVLPRTIPKGSLEQVIFRVDALQWLERLGIPVMNPATAIERTVDKFYTSALLDAAGLPTPRTVVAERMDDAMTAFRALPDGRVFVLEVNGIPGWQGLQSVTDVDVAAAIVEHLEAVVRRR